MLSQSESPTQERKRIPLTRCECGYYVHAEELGEPRCPRHDPVIIVRIHKERREVRLDNGRFAPIGTVRPGFYECWRCGLVKPLDDFYPASSKRNGRQSRCKKCDNSMKTARRREPPSGVVRWSNG